MIKSPYWEMLPMPSLQQRNHHQPKATTPPTPMNWSEGINPFDQPNLILLTNLASMVRFHFTQSNLKECR